MMAILGAIGSVLLFLLKAVLVLLGIFLGLVLLLILIPVSVYIEYENKEYIVKLRLLGIQFQVYPIPKWAERFFHKPELEYHQPSQPEQHQHETAQPMSDVHKGQPLNTQPEPPPKPQKEAVFEKKESIHETVIEPPKQQPAKENPKPIQSVTIDLKKEKIPPVKKSEIEPSTIEKVVSLLKTAKGAVKIAMKGIWVSVWVRWPIQGKDAAKTAISFGRWNGWIGGICASLSNLMQFRLRKLDLIPDFAGEYQGKEKLQAKITASPLVLLIAGFWALKELKNNKIL